MRIFESVNLFSQVICFNIGFFSGLTMEEGHIITHKYVLKLGVTMDSGESMCSKQKPLISLNVGIIDILFIITSSETKIVLNI